MKLEIVVLLLALITAAAAFFSGAQERSCFDMWPAHGHAAQQSLPPVRVVLSRNKVRPGQNVTITIEGVNPSWTFRGFLLVPRNVESTSCFIGTRINSP
jgi:hypothetical protein